jgi:membrane fusion protein (multidrug efflux system)
VAGHVVKVSAEEGQFVKAGTVLVEIDDSDYKVAVERASADYQDALASSQAAAFNVPISQVGSSSQIHSAESDVINTQAGISASTRQVEEAQARLVQAQAQARVANSDVERYGQLVSKKEISQQQYENAQSAAIAANATVTAAEAGVRSAEQVVTQSKARLSQAEAGLANARITPKQIAVIEARARAGAAAAERAKAALDQAQLNLSYTKLVAPVDGVVGSRNAQIGQNVQVGQQLFSLVPLNNIWVTANFKETQLENMRSGQPVKITVDALGGESFEGTVTSIGAATGAKFSLLPPENATGNYVKVVQRVPVRIDFSDRGKADFNQDGRLRPGLSVGPKVRVR